VALEHEIESENLLLNEIQLVLAEKRTSLSALRTGIAVFALPLSVLSLLIATSRYYNVLQVIGWLIPLMLINLALIVLGSYLVIRSIRRIHHYDRMIVQLKKRHRGIGHLIE